MSKIEGETLLIRLQLAQIAASNLKHDILSGNFKKRIEVPYKDQVKKNELEAIQKLKDRT